MAVKKDITTYDVSLNLKVALIFRDLLTEPREGELYYDEDQVTIHSLCTTMQNGLFRSVTIKSNAPGFDFFDSNDSTFVRAFTNIELETFIPFYPNIEGFDYELQGSTNTYTITYKGQVFSSSSNNRADALAVTFTSVLLSEI